MLPSERKGGHHGSHYSRNEGIMSASKAMTEASHLNTRVSGLAVGDHLGSSLMLFFQNYNLSFQSLCFPFYLTIAHRYRRNLNFWLFSCLDCPLLCLFSVDGIIPPPKHFLCWCLFPTLHPTTTAEYKEGGFCEHEWRVVHWNKSNRRNDTH